MTEQKTNTKKELDLRGLVCPEPVLRTKKLLDDAGVSEVEALVDGEVNVNNLSRLARSLKLNFVSAAHQDGFKVVIWKESGPAGHVHAEAQSEPKKSVSEGVGTIIMLAKDKFGDGDPEFSTTLLNLFLQTVFTSGQRPRAILLANTGVRLMSPDSPSLKVLNDFQEAGVEVLACGLCVEFYGLKGKIPVEQITNMFAISEFMFAADKIISP
jgi:selenium metabolism protein YedF